MTAPFSRRACPPRLPSLERHGGQARRLNDRGYVLILVLMVLSLAAVTLAVACRSTLRQSAAASLAAADLQRRWGTATAQYTLLDDASNVLDRADTPAGPPTVTLHESFTLGQLRFDVDVSDEQAKANVNGLVQWRGRTAAEPILRDLARAGGCDVRPRLPADARPILRRPLLTNRTGQDPAIDDLEDNQRVTPRFGCLTEVLPGAGWADLLPSSAGRELTVYGSGAVNVRRAPVAVLSAVCGPDLSPAQASALARAARAAGPTFDVPSAVAATGATATVTSAVQDRLIDGSFTQSVWVTATDGRRTWRSWAVRDATDGEHPRTFTGQW